MVGTRSAASSWSLRLSLAVYLGIYLWSLLMPPLEPVALSSHPNPAATFDEAMTRFDTLLAEEKARGDIDPKCLPYELNHGHKTERAIVLLHGLTACPFQYHELAQLYSDQGYNVLVPRLPRHGLADRTANNLADLTAEELLGVMDPTLDIAVGMGDQVAMFGLSLGRKCGGGLPASFAPTCTWRYRRRPRSACALRGPASRPR